MPKSGASFRCVLMLAGACLPLTWLAVSPEVAQGQEAAQAGAATTTAAQPFETLIQNNCVKCHNTTDWAGSLALDTMDVAHAGGDPEVWEKAINKLRGRLMPPAGEKQPTQPEVDSFISYL